MPNGVENFIGLCEVLGKENASKVKDAITDVIISNIEDAVEEYWIVPPSAITDMIDGVGEEVAQKIRTKYKKALTAVLEKKINEIIEKAEGQLC